MLNGIAGAGAVCCQYGADLGGGGGLGINTKPVSIGGLAVNVPRNATGLAEQIAQALDAAIHGGDGGAGRSGIGVDSAARTYSGGANVIPFPMVNPFKPVVATGSPVTALNRFPKRFTYSFENTDSEPDDEQSSLDGLGTALDNGNPGLGLSWSDAFPTEFPSSSGPSKLQTIIGGIAATLPATVQAFRASPQNIYPQTQAYNPYSYPGGAQVPYGDQGAGADIGGRAGATVGGIGDTIGGIVRDHPYLVMAGIAGAVLLFMNPPRRR